MRLCIRSFAAGLVLAFSAVADAETIQGSCIEVRAVAHAALGQAVPGTVLHAAPPRQTVLAWQVGRGEYGGQKLDGLAIVAVVRGEASVGTGVSAEPGATKTVFFVEDCVRPAAREALAKMAKDLAPGIIHDAGQIVAAKIDVRIAEGCGCGAAVVECPLARLRTRRLTEADRATAEVVKCEKPLGDVFTSNRVIASEFACGMDCAAGEAAKCEPAKCGATEVVAFAGSFSK